MKVHNRFLFLWVLKIRITFKNSRKIGSIVSLIELVKIWWVAMDQHGAIEIWQILQYNSAFLNECKHIVDNFAKSPTNNTNTFVNRFVVLWTYFKHFSLAIA
jgi:hypothetical protein